jgi:hypothetical protein
MSQKFVISRILFQGFLILLAAAWSFAAFSGAGPGHPPSGQAGAVRQEIVYKPLPGSGKKCWINEDLYFTYKFSEKPKMGTVILVIQVFNKNGDKLTPFLIKGRSDMPSMRGAHDSGDQEFKLNKKGDYLLPVNIVMPGDWEVRLTFLKDGKPLFYGSLTFDV